jgi:hypothetical protein
MKELEGIKDAFISQLEMATIMYKTIGSSDKESPMWMALQINWLEENPEEDEKLSLVFKCSRSSVSMSVSCTAEEKEFVNLYYGKAYDYFKRLKYLYIKENHPTVWNEVGKFHQNRIESFLETGDDFSFWNKKSF